MNKDLAKSFSYLAKSIKMNVKAVALDGTQDADVLAILALEKDLLAKIEAVSAVASATAALVVPITQPASAVPAAIDGAGLVV